MTGLPQPTKTRIRSLYISAPGAHIVLDPLGAPVSDPWNLARFVNQLSVFETIKKPYLTGKIVLIDNNNLLDNMKLRGGEPCSFAFDGGDGYVYEQTLNVFSVHGNKSKAGGRAMQYDIVLIGPEYYRDKEQIVQHPFKMMTGTAAASAIHNRYIGGGLNIIMGSMGMMFKEPGTIKSHKPFKAMDEIRQRLCFPGNDGNCLYFKNKFGHQFGPLAAFMAAASSGGQKFIQKTTWGRNFIKDTFEAQAAILFAAADVSDQKPGSAGSQQGGEAKNPNKTVYDNRLKKITQKINPGGGGMANFFMHDGALVDAAVAPFAKRGQEGITRAGVMDGPMMTVSVPIQTGLNVTAGGGCELSLLPPIGDLGQPLGPSIMSGNYMIADLEHKCFLDDRIMNATTTFQAYLVS